MINDTSHVIVKLSKIKSDKSLKIKKVIWKTNYNLEV